MSKKIRNFRDINQCPKSAAEITTGEVSENKLQDDEKDPAAVALGRKGGLKGGKARAKKLSPERRTEIARKAAVARWAKTTKR